MNLACHYCRCLQVLFHCIDILADVPYSVPIANGMSPLKLRPERMIASLNTFLLATTGVDALVKIGFRFI
jgi:hypothetical protein